MLRIPYVPTAYPDEMLASLLTRLVLYNGTGLWRSLLEEVGFGRRAVSPFFSPPMRDARLDGLLAALGYSYSGMLRELTVLPFWLAFNKATARRYQVQIDSSAGPLTELTQLGHHQFLPGARYCPACLRDDIQTHGEPYVHRHHQLSVAAVCTRHGEVLRFACPTCKTTVMPFNRSLLRPPALRCPCGRDLSHDSAPPPSHQQALLRLSRFAADSLACSDAPWTVEQVLAILRERVGLTRENFRHRGLELLQQTYGPLDVGPSRGSAAVGWEEAGSSIRLKMRAGVRGLRAPEFCALLVAAGLTFAEFKQAVAQIRVAAAPAPVKSAPPRPFTVQQARLEFERFESQSPRHALMLLLNSSPRLFWLLRLRDGAWLRRRGHDGGRSVPSIEADRVRIERQFERNGRLSTTGGPWIRATIRDQSWVQARVQARSLNDAAPQTQAQHKQRNRAVALSRAVFSLLRTQARPARIHAGDLAKIVQISMHQAQHTIAHTSALQALIAAVNAGKDRRLAFWAARSFIEAGGSPTAKEVLLRAGLNTTRVNRQFCIEALARLTSRSDLAPFIPAN